MFDWINLTVSLCVTRLRMYPVLSSLTSNLISGNLCILVPLHLAAFGLSWEASWFWDDRLEEVNGIPHHHWFPLVLVCLLQTFTFLMILGLEGSLYYFYCFIFHDPFRLSRYRSSSLVHRYSCLSTQKVFLLHTLGLEIWPWANCLEYIKLFFFFWKLPGSLASCVYANDMELIIQAAVFDGREHSIISVFTVGVVMFLAPVWLMLLLLTLRRLFGGRYQWRFLFSRLACVLWFFYHLFPC